MVKAAVVGAGVFGATIAVDLARAGAKIDLFEARPAILMGTTARCQARLHGGYHYPRSDATAIAARDGAAEFWARYPTALTPRQHFYVVAPDSKVTPSEYLAFCDRLGLPYEVVDAPAQVHTADLVIRVPEAFVDMDRLCQAVRADLWRAGVTVHLSQRLDGPPAGYDMVVMATYGQPWSKPLRYEVCEVALVQLGRYTDESFVVIDGEFVSLDPYRRGHMLYDVKHSVHHANVGWAPEIPNEYQDLLANLGPRMTKLSRFEAMAESAGRFLRFVDPYGRGVNHYAGSLFSIRAVLPDVDATDERPTLIEQDGNVISVLSGKICTAVTAAKTVTEMALGSA